MLLEVSTLNTTGLVVRKKLPETVESALMVTLVLPATAFTGTMPVPVHVTVVPLVGAVLLHAAIAEGVKISDNSATPPMPMPNVLFLFMGIVLLMEICRTQTGNALRYRREKSCVLEPPCFGEPLLGKSIVLAPVPYGPPAVRALFCTSAPDCTETFARPRLNRVKINTHALSPPVKLRFQSPVRFGLDL